MGIIIVLIGFSLVVALGFLWAFLWAVKTGQYDDDVSPSIRILYDNENKSKQSNKDQTND